MKKIFVLTLVVLLLTAIIIPLPVYAEEISTTEESIVEWITEPAGMEPSTEPETMPGGESTGEADTEPPVEVDEWIYSVLQQATPEQVKLIEGIVLGGVGALDKLGINGFDRVRVWVEYNMATVMVAALVIALVAFFVVTLIQKRQLHSDSKDFYKSGKEEVKSAQKACKACTESAEKAAKSAEEAVFKVSEERSLMMAELRRNERVNRALCEEIKFLMQCSDLSQSKREEAEAIFRRGMEAMDDGTNEA